MMRNRCIQAMCGMALAGLAFSLTGCASAVQPYAGQDISAVDEWSPALPSHSATERRSTRQAGSSKAEQPSRSAYAFPDVPESKRMSRRLPKITLTSAEDDLSPALLAQASETVPIIEPSLDEPPLPTEPKLTEEIPFPEGVNPFPAVPPSDDVSFPNEHSLPSAPAPDTTTPEVSANEIPTDEATDLSDQSSEVPSANAVVETMSVDEALEYALDHHPLLRVRRQEIEGAQAKLVTASTWENPQLVFDTESPVHESRPTELTTRVTFTIPTGGKIRRRKAVARAGIDRAQYALRQEAEKILLEAADVAIDVLYYQELVLLNEEFSREAARRAAGAAPPRFDSLDSGINLANEIEAAVDSVLAKVETAGADTQLVNARLALAGAIGMSPEILPEIRGTLTVDPNISLLPLDQVLGIARRTRPDIGSARAGLTESWRSHALAHAEAKPDLNMGPRYQDPLGEDDDRIGARISVDVPVFDRNQGGILESAAEIRANRAMVEAVELESLNDVATAYKELESVHQAVQLYEDGIGQMIDRYEKRISDPGVQRAIGPIQTAQIQQELIAAQRKHLDLRYRFHRLLMRLEVFLRQRVTTTEEVAWEEQTGERLAEIHDESPRKMPQPRLAPKEDNPFRTEPETVPTDNPPAIDVLEPATEPNAEPAIEPAPLPFN